MSMREYGVNDYGYVFTDRMLDEIIDRYFADEMEHGDYGALAEHIGLEYFGEFTGEACQMDEKSNDCNNGDTLYYSADTIYYFQLQSYSTLFTAAYNSRKELIDELKNHYGKWLPNDDDDIYDGVRHIVDTYYG